MPTLANSYLVVSAASNTTALSTTSFTPAVGEVIVVKVVTEQWLSTVGTPSDSQGNTYTLRVSSAASSDCWVGIWTAVASTASANTVTSGTLSTAAWHSMMVERWTNATLAGSPAVNGTKTGSGAPSSTITTTGASSVVSWANGDWNANSPTGRTYNTTSATPTEEGIHDKSTGNYVAYYAWQNAASAGSQTIGITAPTGQAWTVLGIEILNVAGAAGTRQGPMVATAGIRPATSAPAAVVQVSRAVTPLVASASPPTAVVPRAGSWPPVAANPVLIRTTADPGAVAATPPWPVLDQPAPPAIPAFVARPVMLAPRVEQAVLEPPVAVGVAAPAAPRLAPVPVLTRSTADPVAAPDVRPALDIVAAPTSSPQSAPPAVVLVSRDVTPLQPSAHPNDAVISRLQWSTTAPPAVIARQTADPVATDTPPRPLLAAAGAVAYPAPPPALAVSRDVTPLVLSSPPEIPIIGRAPWWAAAPAAVMFRPTADAVDIPPAFRTTTCPAVKLPDLGRPFTWRTMPPPAIEHRTDPVLVLAPPRPPGPGLAWLLSPRSEPPPPSVYGFGRVGTGTAPAGGVGSASASAGLVGETPPVRPGVGESVTSRGAIGESSAGTGRIGEG